MGVHEHRRRAADEVRCAIVTVSDTRSRDSDGSGQLLELLLSEAGYLVDSREIVLDDPAEVQRLLRRLCADRRIDAVVINGGTGVSPRDGTFEAVSELLDKTMDGFGELFRMLSFDVIGPAAMISRATGGLIGDVVVFSLPGSTEACRLAAQRLIVPELGHVVAMARPWRARS
ncbi:MAG: molybdenum cofactor biosynthesis protein B [Candidatus Binatia bacterium]